MKTIPYRFRVPGVLLAALAVAVAASVLVLVGPLAKPAHTQAAAPSTLTGEFLVAFSQGQVTSTSVNCTQDSQGEGTISYTVTGVVPPPFPYPPMNAPYPGTFTESGTIATTKDAGEEFAQVTSLSAEFEIVDEAGTTRVSGTKSLSDESTATALCIEDEPDEFFDGTPYTFDLREVTANDLVYEATIETSSGTFVDRGTSDLFVSHFEQFWSEEGEPRYSQDQLFEESFTSYREALLPSTKGQCKEGGYEMLGFDNQGQCIAAAKEDTA
jgi:hypothetical protein